MIHDRLYRRLLIFRAWSNERHILTPFSELEGNAGVMATLVFISLLLSKRLWYLSLLKRRQKISLQSCFRLVQNFCRHQCLKNCFIWVDIYVYHIKKLGLRNKKPGVSFLHFRGEKLQSRLPSSLSAEILSCSNTNYNHTCMLSSSTFVTDCSTNNYANPSKDTTGSSKQYLRINMPPSLFCAVLLCVLCCIILCCLVLY